MKTQSIHLSIPAPCDQNWSEMTTSGNGRYCGSCEKTVVDFTLLSDRQLVQQIQQSKGEVCGRFSSRQLNRELSLPSIQRSSGLPLAAMVALAITLTASPANSQENGKTTTEIVQDSLKPANKIPSPPLTISGTVKDLVTGEAVYFAIIKLNYQGTGIASAVTDVDGCFSFVVPANELYDSLIIRDLESGFQEKRISMDSNQLTGIEVLLQPEKQEFMGAMLVIKNPDPWYPLEFFSREDLAPRDKKEKNPKKS